MTVLRDGIGRTNRRYVEGQRIYLRECRPRDRATVVIDNTHLELPVLQAPTPPPAQPQPAGMSLPML